MASWARRFGRNPYEQGWKSASKMGSSTSFSAACTTRSAAVGMPSRRTLPFAFGIRCSRTGAGRNRRALSASRSPASSFPAPSPMARGFTPSTPAVRAPRLPRTRFQATTRKAGSDTRLERSSNRRSGSAVAHWCSFVCIRCTRVSASTRSGHAAPVFTGGLHQVHRRCEHAGPLRPVIGLPDLRLLRVLPPRRRHQPTTDLPAGQEPPGR